MNKGFTLVEVLVVMAIVAIVGLILVTIFTNTLRGSTKSQILAVIKQNGQSVLENMDKIIRNADNVICVSSPPSGDTVVIVKNGIYTRFRFKFPVGANGYVESENPSAYSPTICTDPSVSPVILTDTNTQTGVKVESGSFNLSPLPGYKTAVTIDFFLRAGVGARQSIAGQIDPVEFKTTIGLR